MLEATVWAMVDLDASIAGSGQTIYYGDVVPSMSFDSGEVRSLGDRRSLLEEERRLLSQEK